MKRVIPTGIPMAHFSVQVMERGTGGGVVFSVPASNPSDPRGSPRSVPSLETCRELSRLPALLRQNCECHDSLRCQFVAAVWFPGSVVDTWSC
jgi:hypothetical protein